MPDRHTEAKAAQPAVQATHLAQQEATAPEAASAEAEAEAEAMAEAMAEAEAEAADHQEEDNGT